jgi:malonyl-CoA/methylmalonyl-CoA synthetase
MSAPEFDNSAGLFGLIRSAVSDPAKPFIITPQGEITTYAQMLTLSACFANALRELGVQKGDRVALQTEKSVAALMVYLGCLRLGAVYLPINEGYTKSEVAYFLKDAEPIAFVCDPARRSDYAEAPTDFRIRILETLDANGEGSLADRMHDASSLLEETSIDADDLAAMLYTSGTTGRAKGAMLTHGNLASNAMALRDCWGFTSADTLIHALPIFHTHGLFVATNTILLAGASMIYLPKFDAVAIMGQLDRATCLMGVPTFYSRLLAHAGLTREATAAMRLFISGSAPLPAEVHKEFHARTGHDILERYGMTETSINTSNPLVGERRPGTVGMPLPGIDLRFSDLESGREVAAGEIGVIEIKGPNVFSGYWRNPEKTAAEFSKDGFFITGDLGFKDRDGYVSIVGRTRDLIISGGLNVYPAEVEAALDSLPGIRESAVIGLPHDDLGEGVTGIVSPRAGVVLDAEDVRRNLGSLLARYKVPRRIIVVDDLPRNVMGKVQKNVLRESYRSLYAESLNRTV